MRLHGFMRAWKREDAPGADDNASGVAGLLELAAWLGEHPPPRRVDLVGFTLKVLARALRELECAVGALVTPGPPGLASSPK